LDDAAGAEESDSRDHLRGDARDIGVALSIRVDQKQADRHVHRGADADEDVRAEARALAFELPLETDHASADGGGSAANEKRKEDCGQSIQPSSNGKSLMNRML
jgi:hypothetical protein